MAYDTARERVLLVGGYNGTWLSDTWEWDGSAWTQPSAGGLPPRAWHSLAYDSAQRELVVFGGERYPTVYADTWTLPSGTFWQPAPPLLTPRTGIRAACCSDPCGNLYVVGGTFCGCANAQLASVEVFDGVQWNFLPSMMTTPRQGSVAVCTGGFLYAIGGGIDDGHIVTVFSSLERLNLSVPQAGWDPSTVPPLPEARYDAAGVVDRLGRIWVIGGQSAYGAPTLQSVVIFDPANPQYGWTAGPTLNVSREWLGAAMDSQGRLYAIGGAGIGVHQSHLSSVERFDPAHPELGWVYIQSIPGPQASNTSNVGVGADGKIYLAGGWAPGYMDRVLRYDPSTEQWEAVASLGQARNNLGLALGKAGKIYAIGGDSGFVPVTTVESLDTGPGGPAGQASLANAGADQTVPEGTMVTLDGSASTGSGCGPPLLAWIQIAGPSVFLNTADAAHPTFTSPFVSMGGATLTFRLDVSDGQGGAASDIVNITVTNVNHAPIANAGPDQIVSEGSPVTLDGSLSFDADSDFLFFMWAQVAGPPVQLDQTDPAHAAFTAPLVGPAGAVLTFTLFVGDSLDTGVDSVDITIENVNHAPIASAGPDAAFDEGAQATLDASASTDPDADPLTFSWQQLSGPAVTLSDATNAGPGFAAPQVGSAGATLIFRVTVSDGLASSTDDVSLFIRNLLSPPVCTMARPSVDVLWPPNHKLVPVTILGVGDAGSGQVTITILGVTQDEPVNGLGDGDSDPDAVIQGGTVLLRAERAGDRNGRVYRVTFRAANAGGQCTGSVIVCVPHDRGSGSACIDDGQAYNSRGP